MKSNQKGFTLIELLAVIVILAVIALIATPIVLNIITKAKKSAAADSIYGAMEAMRLAYAESLMDTQPYVLPMEVNFANKKILYGTEKTDSGNLLTTGGTLPTAGTITLNSEGKFADTTGIVVNDITCSITGEKVSC